MRKSRLLTVAGAAQVERAGLLTPSCFPFHRTSPFGTINDRSVTERTIGRCTAELDRRSGAVLRSIQNPGRRMIQDFELLAGKVTELARLLQSLRTENQQLRAQLATASAELDSMRIRVDEASRRLDGLIERLPIPHNASQEAPGVSWNT
jgi:cell division protein ZapB